MNISKTAVKDEMLNRILSFEGLNIWSDEGGVAISREVVFKSVELFSKYPRISELHISPTPNGGIMWESGHRQFQNSDINVEIMHDLSCELNVIINERDFSHIIPHDAPLEELIKLADDYLNRI